MATKQIVNAPKAPKAPKLPGKPQSKGAVMAPVMAPNAPKAPKAPAAPAAGRKGPQAPQAAAPKAPGRVPNVAIVRAAPVADTATAKELEAAKAKIAQLEAKLSATRLNKNARSIDDILGGAPESDERAALLSRLPAKDWRKQYQGHIGEFKDFVFVDDVLNVQETTKTVMCAIPRDSDVGNIGTAMRNEGKIAIHFNTDENGNYVNAPAYVTEEEFAHIWLYE